jgi:hypothetical protein
MMTMLPRGLGIQHPRFFFGFGIGSNSRLVLPSSTTSSLRPFIAQSTVPTYHFSSSSTFQDGSEKRKMLITTPIFYVNAKPHIGHLYSALIADALSRWKRLKGKETLFSTGTDEHGSKVEEAARKKEVPVEKFCSDISKEFQNLFDLANISYDDYIR